MKIGPLQINTIYGAEGEHPTPYMTRVILGRLRLHIFHRGDLDRDPHDHPWTFWTFPLTTYVEEVTDRFPSPWDRDDDDEYVRRLNVVNRFRLHKRPAGYTHRVLGPSVGYAQDLELSPWAPVVPLAGEGKIITLVWYGREVREWGFLKERNGRWCWEPWRDYLFKGGKHAPCED